MLPVLTASRVCPQEEVAARARLTRGGATAPSSAVVAQPAGGDWDIDDEPLEDLQPVRAAAPPLAARPAPAAAPSRPVVAHVRPAPSAGATKPMKLGASKLGASKLKGGDIDLEALLAD